MSTAARGAALGALFLLLLAFFLVRLFPADVVARALLARLPPGWPAIVFGRAQLGIGALELDDVTLLGADGRAVLRLPHAAFRPSLAGLWSHAGLPWHLGAAACGGTAEAVVSGAPDRVTVGWRDVDLGACPPLAVTGNALDGRATLAARLAVGAALAGEGTVEVRGATWRTATGPLAAFGALHAARALVRWTLDDGRLRLTALELHGPEVAAEGGGEVRLVEPLDQSAVDVHLRVSPAPDAPEAVRVLLAFLPGPPGDGARTVGVAGTIGAPVVVAP